jgi:phosphatidate cytidylyltransferase
MTRVLSGAVLVALVVGTVWLLPPWATAVLAARVALSGGIELAGLAGRSGATVPASFVGLSAAALTLAFVFYDRRIPGSDADSLGAVLLALLVAAGCIALVLGPPSPATMTRSAVLVMAPVYVGLPLGAIVWVHWVFGAAATIWLLGTLAASDTAQFYVGRAVGRNKLAAVVSPAKTLEGAAGGLVAAGVAGAWLGPWAVAGLPAWVGALLAVALALFGIAGDLFESLLKRSVGAKDASGLIPDHGGVLDRIDSYLFAAPVFYLFLRYVSP